MGRVASPPASAGAPLSPVQASAAPEVKGRRMPLPAAPRMRGPARRVPPFLINVPGQPKLGVVIMNRIQAAMIPRAAEPVPGLPPYDPGDSVSLATACRLGLVPGHDGRRAVPAEVRKWARSGFAVGPFGPRYLFPAMPVGGAWRTTVQWCCAWVQFIAEVQAGDGPTPRDPRRAMEWG